MWENDGCGNNDDLSRLLPDLSSKGVISGVSENHDFTARVSKAGEVFTWSEGTYGVLGYGDENDQKTPKRVEALIGVKAKNIFCSDHHITVRTEDGSVYTFGKEDYGQLGHGDEMGRISPSLVKALEG